MRHYYRHVIGLSILSVFILGTSFFAGVYVGFGATPEVSRVSGLFGKESSLDTVGSAVDFTPFWQTWNVIDEKYIPANGTTTEVTDQERVWGAIQGLVGSLGDPYSVFLPPADAELFEENVRGNFGGVGMEIGMRDGFVTIVAPLKDTPAEHAGVRAGDKIIAIDDASAIDMTTDEAVKLIRGEVGTDVTLTLQREGVEQSIEITITRAVIQIPTIETELRDDGVFVIELFNFSASSPDLFRQSLRDFVLSGSTKLLLDLRGNPGGFLQAAVDIASWFLPIGKTIVVEDYAGNKNDVIHRSRGYDIFNENLSMVILVDGGTASAAEIVTGALSEHGIARVVGTKTFGKGSVQELIKITSDTSLKLTIAHWRTPKGTLFSKEGLSPDVPVEFTEEHFEAGEDPQLDKVIELLLQ